MTNLLCQAIEMAHQAHGNQLDRGGEPYIWHSLRTGISLLPDETAAIVGVLHDTVEDTELSLDRIEVVFGPEIAGCISFLTHIEGMTYEAYIRRCSLFPITAAVKRADLRDNLDPRRIKLAESAGHDVGKLILRYTRALREL